MGALHSHDNHNHGHGERISSPSSEGTFYWVRILAEEPTTAHHLNPGYFGFWLLENKARRQKSFVPVVPWKFHPTSVETQLESIIAGSRSQGRSAVIDYICYITAVITAVTSCNHCSYQL